MASTLICITGDDVAKYDAAAFAPRLFKQLADSLRRVVTGQSNKGSSVTVIPSAVRASNTLTPGAVSAGNTCSVAGQTFTAAASNPAANQFLAGEAAVAGPDLARAINASTATKNIVRATCTDAGVVTVTCLTAGEVGNKVACTGGTNITIGSGSTLLNGAGTATYRSF